MSDPLTHYVVVRRDLPLGVMAAQLVHAAGESFFKLSFPGSSVQSAAAPQGQAEAAGSTPAPGATLDVSQTIAVVLGARNEAKLLKLERELVAAGVPHVAVREPDAPWNGQLMSIGAVPGNKEALRAHFREFHRLPEPAPASGAASTASPK